MPYSRVPDAVAEVGVISSAAPGGTASNVISIWRKRTSRCLVTMTSISTLLAPRGALLHAWLVGSRMPVDGAAMARTSRDGPRPCLEALSFLRRGPARGEDPCAPCPGSQCLGISATCCWSSCRVRSTVLTSGALIIAVVICHSLLGYLFGYLAGRVRRLRWATHDRDRYAEFRAGRDAGEDPSPPPQKLLPAARLLRLQPPSGALLAAFFRRWKAVVRPEATGWVPSGAHAARMGGGLACRYNPAQIDERGTALRVDPAIAVPACISYWST